MAASEPELERMVVRLLLDAQQYQDQLRKAQEQTKSFVHEVKERVAGAMTAFGAGGWLKEGLANFQEAQDIGNRLSAVLETQGREVEELTQRYETFAKQLEKTTTLEDDQVLALLTLAESYDLTAEKAEQAVKDAHAVAAINGGVADSYLRIAAAMQEGDLEKAMGMARMVPQLRGVKDEAEFVAKWMTLTAAGMKAAEKAAESSSGQMKTLKRDFGNLLEELGGFVARGINPVVKAAKDAVNWFRTWDEGAKEATTALLGVAAAAGALHATVGLTNPLGWITLAAGSAFALTSKIVASTDAAKGLAAALEAAAAQSALVKKNFAENAARVKQLVESVPGFERRDVLAKEILQQERLVELWKEQVKAAERFKEERLGTVPGDPMENINRALRSAFGPEGDMHEDNIRRANEEFAAARGNAQALRRQMDQLAGTGMTEQATRDLEKFNAELEKTIRQLGMTDLQKKLDDQMGKGARGPMMEQAEALIRMKQEADKFAESQKAAKEAVDELRKSAMDMAEDLEAQIAAFGMSAEHARILKMEMQGLSGEMADYLTNLANTTDAQKEFQKLVDEGKRVTEQILGRNPAEKFKREVEQLNRLLEGGHITFDVYQMGLKQLEEEFQKAGKAARKAWEKFDQALAGGAEARQRFQHFKDTLLEQSREMKKLPQVQRHFAPPQGGAIQQPGQLLDEAKIGNELLRGLLNRPVLVVEPANI